MTTFLILELGAAPPLVIPDFRSSLTMAAKRGLFSIIARHHGVFSFARQRDQRDLGLLWLVHDDLHADI
jgi:hypothetical protein